MPLVTSSCEPMEIVGVFLAGDRATRADDAIDRRGAGTRAGGGKLGTGHAHVLQQLGLLIGFARRSRSTARRDCGGLFRFGPDRRRAYPLAGQGRRPAAGGSSASFRRATTCSCSLPFESSLACNAVDWLLLAEVMTAKLLFSLAIWASRSSTVLRSVNICVRAVAASLDACVCSSFSCARVVAFSAPFLVQERHFFL